MYNYLVLQIKFNAYFRLLVKVGSGHFVLGNYIDFMTKARYNISSVTVSHLTHQSLKLIHTVFISSPALLLKSPDPLMYVNFTSDTLISKLSL